MHYLIRAEEKVDSTFIEKTKETVNNIAQKMNLEESLPVISLVFYHKWKEAEKVHRVGEIRGSKYPAFSCLRLTPDWGFVGEINVVEELFGDVDEKVFVAYIGHELGHIKRNVDDDYKTSAQVPLVSFLEGSFRPYFDEKYLTLLIDTCLDTPEEYYAETNLLNAGFVEESFALRKYDFSTALPLMRRVFSDRRLLQLHNEIRRICPYFFLTADWYSLSRYPTWLARGYALVSHKDVPNEFKQAIEHMWEEFEQAFKPHDWYTNAYQRIREDFLSNPRKYFDVWQVPESLLRHFKTFTYEYAGKDHLPTWEEQKEMMGRKWEELHELLAKHEKLLAELTAELT